MRELSLFTGAGGGLLGTHLLGWTPVGYVENDDYCQRVLAQRIQDGFIPEAPIFGDIRAFIREGYADSYSGMVDVITAGFPCPAYSSAARGRNLDEKNLWEETAAVINAVNPPRVFLENVVGIRGYLPRIGRDLAEMGYSLAPVAEVSAASVGAPHPRRRVWIVANSDGNNECRVPVDVEMAEPQEVVLSSGWGEFDRRILGMDDGMAGRMERYSAIGNGQVPRVVQTAWEVLSE